MFTEFFLVQAVYKVLVYLLCSFEALPALSVKLPVLAVSVDTPVIVPIKST